MAGYEKIKMANNREVAWSDCSGSPVLCVIDMSEGSKEALHSAINIAGNSSSRLTVLYPYRLNQPRAMADVSQWKKSIAADASESFTRMTSTLLKDLEVACDFKPEVGFINDRVDAFTQKHKPGIIVIGKHLVESNGENFQRMLSQAECPVLIIPGKTIS